MGEKGIKLVVTETAKDYLGAKGYDEVFGARPLRRTIQDTVEDKLSEDLLRGCFKDGDTVVIDMPEGAEGLQFEVEKAKEEALAGKKR
jgi:ATP-dependent Clp protease ATP-binding subunit ClpC